jgi:single-strand DNA-binding protein
MSSLNKVMLIGNVGKDPEVTTFEGGNKVAKFTLATSERYTDKSGQKQEKTEWHNIVAWGTQADVIEKYVTKGKQLYVEGQITSRSWEQDGVKRYATDIKLTSFVFLSSANGGSKENGSENYSAPKTASATPKKTSTSSAKAAAPAPEPIASPAVADTDDDLPF